MRDQAALNKFLAERAAIIALVGGERQAFLESLIKEAWHFAYWNGREAGAIAMVETWRQHMAEQRGVSAAAK